MPRHHLLTLHKVKCRKLNLTNRWPSFFLLRSLKGDNVNFQVPNGLVTNDLTSITFGTTNTGFVPISGTDFTLFMPHAVGHCSIGFNRFFTLISPVDAVNIYISDS